MKSNDFVFKYRVVDGAVDIADDVVVVSLNEEQVDKLILAWDGNISHDGTFDVDFADGVDEMIEKRIEDDAKVKYGDRIQHEMCANIYDFEATVAEMKEWYNSISI